MGKWLTISLLLSVALFLTPTHVSPDVPIIRPASTSLDRAPTTVAPTTVPPTTSTVAVTSTSTSVPEQGLVGAPAHAGHNWEAVADCESGDGDGLPPYVPDWSLESGNGFSGGLQFTLTSWAGVGGTGRPSQHSRSEQITKAEKLLSIQGRGAWPHCGRFL